MNRHFDQTIHYYNDHVDEYVLSTVNVNMHSLYERFLELVPTNGRILDAGCGSGRDTMAFLQRGFDVTSIDASENMVAATTRLAGRSAQWLRFQEMEYRHEFDGIWACASLLHVPRDQLDEVLDRIALALRQGGVCFMSFKEGDDERMHDGRLFTDFTADRLESWLRARSDLSIVSIWLTCDLRTDSQTRWVNALVKNCLKL